MNFSNYALLFCVFVTANMFLCVKCDKCSENDNKVRRKLYDATYQTLSLRLSSNCIDVFYNRNNTQSKYISSKGLSGLLMPSGTFPTTDLAIDILYGLICPIGFPSSARAYLQSIDLVRVTYDPKSYIVQTEFIYNLTNGRRLTAFAAIAFDKDYKICGYNGQIRNEGLTFDIPSIENRQRVINGTCILVDRFCTGASKQYDSVDACREYLTTRIPFGSFDQTDQSNAACRLAHSVFLPVNATRYCARVGPSGGGICTDKTIDYYYEQPDSLACAHRYK